MDQDRVCRVRAWYASKRDRRDLEINVVEAGGYAVLGEGDWSYYDQFPLRERMSREATVDSEYIDEWLDELLSICKPDWYHHYRGMKDYLGRSVWAGYRWGLRIERASGALERWEGEGLAPERLADAFEKLFACGMPKPPLMPEYWTMRPSEGEHDPLDRLSCYNQLLERAGGLRQSETLAEDTVLLLREFIDDIQRYVRRNCQDFSLDMALEVWGIEPTLAGLRAVDVSQAPRMEMLTLYATLAQMDNAEGAAASLFRDKTIGRWTQRLEELPAEEEQEFKRLERERRRALRLAVDKAVRERISSGEEFTIRQLADETGTTVSRVSTRVRNFVRRGELRAVNEGKPRRYRAA